VTVLCCFSVLFVCNVLDCSSITYIFAAAATFFRVYLASLLSGSYFSLDWIANGDPRGISGTG